MVVDDDENLRLLYEEVLTDEGYSVMLAKNGKEALRKVEQKEPHLVILDIVMPEMDGMEAMLRILRKHRKTPVILNTAYTRYREDFMTWAADAYVMKSSDLSELKAKVKQLLAMPYQEVEQFSSDLPLLKQQAELVRP